MEKDWRFKHGHTRGGKTKNYHLWQRMRYRCNVPTNKDYKWYGAKGITVSDEWNEDYEAFLRDMGEQPPGMTLERIDNLKGYSKDNCRWATRAEQSRNRSVNRLIEYNGVTMCLCDWATKVGVNRWTIRARLERGEPPEKAFRAVK